MKLSARLSTWWNAGVQQPGQRVAEEAFVGVWTKVRSNRSTRHPFHRELLLELDELIDAVITAPADTMTSVDNVPVEWNELPRRFPRVARRLTPDWMRSFVLAEVDRVAAVADSTDYLVEQTWKDERHEMTVQHRMSGLRALFAWRDRANIGTILAKSYGIPSIDPDRSWPHEGINAVDQWEGLGITGRIYDFGAGLQPDVRWSVGMLTEQSAALRRRIHKADPWRFASASGPLESTAQDGRGHPCRWCIEHGGWATIDRGAFADHPR